MQGSRARTAPGGPRPRPFRPGDDDDVISLVRYAPAGAAGVRRCALAGGALSGSPLAAHLDRTRLGVRVCVCVHG